MKLKEYTIITIITIFFSGIGFGLVWRGEGVNILYESQRWAYYAIPFLFWISCSLVVIAYAIQYLETKK